MAAPNAPQPSAPPFEDEDQAQDEEFFGTDPPSKTMTMFDAIVIILYYIGLDLGISMLLLIKHVKDNWPLYKCKTNYMLFSWFSGTTRTPIFSSACKPCSPVT